jgi:hypothetical protein
MEPTLATPKSAAADGPRAEALGGLQSNEGKVYLKQQYSSFSITATFSFRNRVLNPPFLRIV